MIHLQTTGTTRNPIGSVAPMDTIIAVGFGSAVVMHDGELVVDGEERTPKRLRDADGWIRLARVERLARRSPGGLWLLRMDAPLWSAAWQRKRGQWVCIEAGLGFA